MTVVIYCSEMERITVGLLCLDGLTVNANCSDLHSFGESPFGPCWGDGWERELPVLGESFEGSWREIKLCFCHRNWWRHLATQTSSHWAFSSLCFCCQLLSKAFSKHSVKCLFCLLWFWKWSGPSLISGAALKPLILLLLGQNIWIS